jgi:hypothetical protein
VPNGARRAGAAAVGASKPPQNHFVWEAMCGRQQGQMVLGNLAWFICGGFLIFLEYLMVGLLFSVTIVLFKTGSSVFRLAFLVAAPIGRDWGVIVDKAVPLCRCVVASSIRSCCLC